MAGLVVLDAGVLIALYDAGDSHHRWALDVFRQTLSHDLVMSVLTYAEVMVHPAKAGVRERFEEDVAGLRIEIREVAPEDAGEIAALRASSSLRMPDVVSLHLALSLGATLATTNKSLADEAGSKALSVMTPGVLAGSSTTSPRA
jgi:predicted nucleic acid-binding protein